MAYSSSISNPNRGDDAGGSLFTFVQLNEDDAYRVVALTHFGKYGLAVAWPQTSSLDRAFRNVSRNPALRHSLDRVKREDNCAVSPGFHFLRSRLADRSSID